MIQTYVKNFLTWVSQNVIFAAWVLAVLAILGSISLSEVWGFVPCKLCWYQRYLLFAAAVVLGAAEYKKYHHIYKYVLPLTLIGAVLAFYQSLLQWGFIEETLTCAVDAPCALAQINWLGFITIPFMSLAVFVVLSGLMVYQHKRLTGKDSDE